MHGGKHISFAILLSDFVRPQSHHPSITTFSAAILPLRLYRHTTHASLRCSNSTFLNPLHGGKHSSFTISLPDFVRPQSHHPSTTTSSAAILPLGLHRHTTHASLRCSNSTFLNPLHISQFTPTTSRKPTSIKMSMEAGIGLMGTKLGMMTYLESTGKVVPVTVIGFREGNIVTQVKTDDTDGYNAVQVGYRRVRHKKLTKPEMGQE